VLADDQLRLSLAREGRRQAVEHFAEDDIVRRYRDLYRRTLEAS
jgi:glycosyltransferase involved in cell wall biosynthesis